MSKALYVKIAKVTTALTKSYATVHAVAVECLAHAHVHGDARPFLTLVMGLPKATYREGLVFWAEKFSPVRINLSTEKCGLLAEGNKKYVPFDLAGAEATPFWELDEVANALAKKPLTVESLSKSVNGFKAAKLKQINKQLEEGLIDQQTADGMVAYLNRVEIRVAA